MRATKSKPAATRSAPARQDKGFFFGQRPATGAGPAHASFFSPKILLRRASADKPGGANERREDIAADGMRRNGAGQTATGSPPPATPPLQRKCTDCMADAGQSREVSGTGMIQRAPLSPETGSTEDLHRDLTGEFSRETGMPDVPGAQYSPEYARWLTIRSGSHIQFLPPSIRTADPLARARTGQPPGHTAMTINGQSTDANTIGARETAIVNLITPTAVHHGTGSAGGQGSCNYDLPFKIESQAQVTEASPPGANGWQGQLPGQTFVNLQARFPARTTGDARPCAGKNNVPVTMHGQPSDAGYRQLIHDAEMEHVRELEILHKRHFVPYYQFVMGLKGSGATQADCTANLRQQIGLRAEQAALGFILADMAEGRKFDDPASTHHDTAGQMTIGSDCGSVTLTVGQEHPQQAGLAPGNVRTVPPLTRRINPANLSVSGNTLQEGATVIQTFGSPANAAQALNVLTTYGITEIQTIGAFQLILANGQPPGGLLAGVSSQLIDPGLFQVTIGMPNPADWMISQVVEDRFLPILNFGASRDEAYTAVALMRQFSLTRQCWIGPANAPEFMFFLVH